MTVECVYRRRESMQSGHANLVAWSGGGCGFMGWGTCCKYVVVYDAVGGKCAVIFLSVFACANCICHDDINIVRMVCSSKQFAH